MLFELLQVPAAPNKQIEKMVEEAARLARQFCDRNWPIFVFWTATFQISPRSRFHLIVSLVAGRRSGELFLNREKWRTLFQVRAELSIRLCISGVLAQSSDFLLDSDLQLTIHSENNTEDDGL